MMAAVSWFSTGGMMFRFLNIAITIFAVIATAGIAVAQDVDLKFCFGSTPLPGYTQVSPSDAYSADRGYGFDLGSKVQADSLAVTGAAGKPFFFSVKLAPGEYQVAVTLGDAAGDSTTTVKSETRRLMLQAVHTGPGESIKKTFLVHVRVPQISGDGVVSFKDREKLPILYVQWDDATRVPFTELDWDEKLTLEFRRWR
jgi:hypothetical protein